MILERSDQPEGAPSSGKRAGGEPSGEELLEAARKKGHSLFERQKRAAVEELSSLSGVMKDAAAKLSTTDEIGVGDYVRKASEYVDRLSSSLREREPGELLGEWKRILRERPALCLGLTVGAGFLFGRLLRTGASQVDRTLAGAGSPGTTP